MSPETYRDKRAPASASGGWLIMVVTAVLAVLAAAVVLGASAASASHSDPVANPASGSPPAQLSPPVGLSPPVDLSPPVELSPPGDLSPIAFAALPATGTGGPASNGWLRIAILSAVGLAMMVTVAGAALELRREG